MGQPVVGSTLSELTTFLFTDIEGSTRRWEEDPEAMQSALADHDAVLRQVVTAQGGRLYKHTGDGVRAVFGSPNAAVQAATDAQGRLELPVRMSVVTGEAHRRGDEYFGPVLNRAARMVEVGHAGQILVAETTARSLRGIDLVDLGLHQLRDLRNSERLFQVRAEHLSTEFPPLRSAEALLDHFGALSTSFVGRDAALKEVAELVGRNRLVTLTGAGGVGKTRLATTLAADLMPEFDDGVWIVELARVSDGSAVADVVASTLGVPASTTDSVMAGIANWLRGRRSLIVFDNCEHLLQPAAAVVQSVLAAAPSVAVVATSREGLQVPGERLWPVPALSVDDGVLSPAVQLFTARAEAANPRFSLESKRDADAVIEICHRLDGLALAIELAAARMTSMTPLEVLDRLDDRFHLLAAPRQHPAHHQTLRRAVQWSWDLLTESEQAVLGACSVFSGGFDLSAAARVCDQSDDYAVLDALDSLVRKSLITATRRAGRTRYGLLETIRHFAQEQHAASARSATADIGNGASPDPIARARDRHARYFAQQAEAQFERWDSAHMAEATTWLDSEYDNLRASVRWASRNGDLDAAVAIAAHTAMIAFALQRLEPVSWAEALIPDAAEAHLEQLPRLYTAASLCAYAGRPDDALKYASAAAALRDDAAYQGFDPAWVDFRLAVAELDAGRAGQYLEICHELTGRPGLSNVVGLCGLLAFLPSVGRADEALAIADETMAAARVHGNPYWVAFAYVGRGRAMAADDPAGGLEQLREGLTFAAEHPIPYWEAVLTREAGGLEAAYGDPDQALDFLDASLVSFDRSGTTATIAWTLASLAVLFHRIGRLNVAATPYGATTDYPIADHIVGLATTVEQLEQTLGDDAFRHCRSLGHAMSTAEAVAYARRHIDEARWAPIEVPPTGAR